MPRELPKDQIQEILKVDTLKKFLADLVESRKITNISTTPIVPVAPKIEGFLYDVFLPRLPMNTNDFLGISVFFQLRSSLTKEEYLLVFELREELIRRFKSLESWRLKVAYLLFSIKLMGITLNEQEINKIFSLRSYHGGGFKTRSLKLLSLMEVKVRELTSKVKRPRIRGYRDGKGGKKSLEPPPLPEIMPKNYEHNQRFLENRSNWLVTNVAFILYLISLENIVQIRLLPETIQWKQRRKWKDRELVEDYTRFLRKVSYYIQRTETKN